MTTLTMKRDSAHVRRETRKCSRMQRSIKENGWSERTSVREEERKFGQTDRCMKVTGEIIKPMERAALFMQTVTCTTEPGKTTKHTEEACTATWMELDILVSGKRINNTARELRRGLMVPLMMANM